MNTYTITPEEAGERLDKWLVGRFSDRSRSALQKSILAGQVLLNGKKVSTHIALKAGDTVEVDLAEAPSKKTLISPNPKVPFEVLVETPDYVVVNKPTGVVMHQSDNHRDSDTLANGLLARYPELSGVGEEQIRPGIVHRLDQDVSGVVIVARTQAMYDHLKQQFQNRSMVKEYIALVHGTMSQAGGTIDFPIARSVTNPTKMAAKPKGETFGTREALTEYTVEQQFQPVALLRVRIHTGRTHQIRVHMNAIGHPIVGDNVYKPADFKSSLQPGRVMLHAQKLTFTDLAGAQQTVEAPIPPEFQTYIDRFSTAK